MAIAKSDAVRNNIIGNFRQLFKREYGIPSTLSDESIEQIIEGTPCGATAEEFDERVLVEMYMAEGEGEEDEETDEETDAGRPDAIYSRIPTINLPQIITHTMNSVDGDKIVITLSLGRISEEVTPFYTVIDVQYLEN